MDPTFICGFRDEYRDTEAKAIPPQSSSPFIFKSQLEDFPRVFHDSGSTPNTPSMTRGSSSFSRSTSSSVVTCEACGHSSQQCFCTQSEAGSTRIHLSETESPRSQSSSPAIFGRHIGKAPSCNGSKATELILRPKTADLQHRNLARFQRWSQNVRPQNIPGGAGNTSTEYKAHQGIETLTMGQVVNYGPEPERTPCDSNSDMSEDEDEESDEDENVEDNNWSGQEGNLEAIVLEVLGEDLALAAHLIPMLHKTHYLQFKNDIKLKVGPWASNVTVAAAGGASSGQSQSPDTSSGNGTGNPRKRQRRSGGYRRNPDEEDEEEDDDDEEENRDSNGGAGNGENSSPQEVPRLACPFHKENPSKYCTQHTAVDQARMVDYRTCAGPGFKSIARLKEHLKRKHYPVQCGRCYEIFPGSDRSVCALALESHSQLSTPCERRDPALKEGISGVQWVKLDKKKSAKKNQASTRIEKYWEIWDILFPGVERPLTPWYDEQLPKRHQGFQQDDTHRFSLLFENMLAVKVKQDDIVFAQGREDVMKQRIVALVERAFEVHFRINGHSSSTSSSSTRSLPLLGGSFEQISTPSTAVGRISTSSSRSTAIRNVSFSTPVHEPRNQMLPNSRTQVSEMGSPYMNLQPMIPQGFVQNSMASTAQSQLSSHAGYGTGIPTSMDAYPGVPFNNAMAANGNNWGYIGYTGAGTGFDTNNSDTFIPGGGLVSPRNPASQGLNGWEQIQDQGRMHFDGPQ